MISNRVKTAFRPPLSRIRAVEIASLGDNPSLGTGFLPTGIAAGPDENVWISKLSAIARVSPAGQVTEVSIGGDAIPTSITVGPGAHLWFVDTIGPFVARRQGSAG
jgi:streptogramin lyase